jgi:L-ribulokinase
MPNFADADERPVRVAASDETPALGSAIHAAVAVGPAKRGYATVGMGAEAMAHRDEHVCPPAPDVLPTYRAPLRRVTLRLGLLRAPTHRRRVQ